MNPRINKVRKSISARKRSRGISNSDSNKNSFTPFPLEEEEKHGYFPIFTDSGTPKRNKSRLVSGFILKGILSSILFLGTALLLQTHSEVLQKPKIVASSLLTNEFPFAKVNQWYQDTLGEPLALTPKGDKEISKNSTLALPVSGNISESFQSNGEGVLISPDEPSAISVLREGVIIFAGNDPETNKTIVVQHADGSKSTYGFLSSMNVHLYEFVDDNQVIGKFVPSNASKSVYFAIEKNEEYVDPVQVIEVNDRS
ncbi:stage IV sporulation protein FA [Virgibacillus phasianinus]|uniref:Stage IV sporulation protein FA n=1 Tax=Virgibacillus phasianinus TaxID=2017483 RepID=A0A220U4Q4_9BACI|nr:M23 family metallopeptidase [Virgibacillus phasianinus]ASK63070.1 stage IV sporulation protein FA [Virgibacillus phasianinus]